MLLLASALIIALGPAQAPAKKPKAKVRNPGHLVTATQTRNDTPPQP